LKNELIIWLEKRLRMNVSLRFYRRRQVIVLIGRDGGIRTHDHMSPRYEFKAP